LTIGYGKLGFGTHQYNVLDVPEYCQHLNINWLTDPHRHHFVRLHSLIFASGTLGILVALGVFFDTNDQVDYRINFKIYHRPIGNVHLRFKFISILQIIVAISIGGPDLAGVLMAAITNGHSHLILGQKQCYASFISSRFGYINEDYVSWRTKVATWIGLTT
jgi:hypothetical protein